MKTLNECFEEGGSKFPFSVYWKDSTGSTRLVVIDRAVWSLSPALYHRWIPAQKVGNKSVDQLSDDGLPFGFQGYGAAHDFTLAVKMITEEPKKDEQDRREALAEHIFSIIKHGDYEHKKWLRLKSYEVAESWFRERTE